VSSTTPLPKKKTSRELSLGEFFDLGTHISELCWGKAWKSFPLDVEKATKVKALTIMKRLDFPKVIYNELEIYLKKADEQKEVTSETLHLLIKEIMAIKRIFETYLLHENIGQLADTAFSFGFGIITCLILFAKVGSEESETGIIKLVESGVSELCVQAEKLGLSSEQLLQLLNCSRRVSTREQFMTINDALYKYRSDCFRELKLKNISVGNGN